MRTLTLARFALLSLATATSTFAGLTAAEQKELKTLTKGTLYLRIDAPCATGRHAYGTYKRPLVEVSPTGVNTDAENTVNASWWHADSTYWGVSVNDQVKVSDINVDNEENSVELELEGVGPTEGNDTVVKLVKIMSLDDFKTAYGKVFSTKPLQDEHDDWSAEVKAAIAKRQLVAGMTKRQAYCVTGNPERFEKSAKDGKEVETWYLRQNKGTKMGYFTMKSGTSTGMPATIKFEDGKLTDIAATGAGAAVDLGN
jgi:hypothetical protein